jgi:hypothetical protein
MRETPEQKTLRDEFAMAAMQGLLSSQDDHSLGNFFGEDGFKLLMKQSYEIANEAMQERMK